jgi:hypothetical protein
MIVLNVMLVGTPQSPLIVDLLREDSRSLDQFEWKDRISKEKGIKLLILTQKSQSTEIGS